MEISGVRRVLAYTGEEKYQMLELNRRLETYLNHVKLLEEENHLLWGEIQALRKSQDSGGQRKAQVEALSQARREVQISWREKDCVDLEICNLLEEVEELNALRQKERAAQAAAKRRLEESRKMLEDERRMQIWLRDKAAHLERELSTQVKVYEEDMAVLKSSLSISKPVRTAPQHSQTLNLQGLAEEYSQKAAQAWQEASGTYQKQVEKLEESLKQSRAYMDQISQEKKESHLQLQALAKELENMKVKRELLEKNMAKQKDSQNKEHHHFQAHIETLEAEKVDIEQQIGELLVDRRNLLQMKMSLGIEVATYRALLDNENLRANKQSPAKKTHRVLEGITKTHRTYPGTQTHLGISSCLLSSPLSTTSKSITSKPSLMSQAPLWPLTRSTTQETPKKPKEVEILIHKKTTNLQSSPATLAKPSTRAGSQVPYESSDAHKDASYIAEDKPDSILSPSVKEDLFEAIESRLGSQQVLSGSSETEVITSQTPDKEVSSSLHIDDAKCSEDGDEEEIEVSAEMAQISHAPMSAWEETDTAIVDERDVVSELELASENITENSTQEFRLDARQPEIEEFGKNTNTLLPSLSADAFSPDEETSEMITWTDLNESVIHFVEEESLKSSPEDERESVEGTKEVDSTLAEVFKSQDFDHEEHEEKNEDREVEQRKEVTNGTEQQSLIMEVTSVMDNNEKEVEAITNNSTQEFRLEAGPTDFMQPDENTITLAPSLTEDTPLAAHTFSPDEESSEFLTWADVKESVTRFVEEEPLQSAPETERESVERTEDEETSEILDVKESVIHCVEEESLKSVPETESESVEQTTEVDSTVTEVSKGQDFDSEEHEVKSEDRQVKQRKEEEETIGTEQQKLIVEVTAVMDNNENEVEAIINNSTQEFRLDAGLSEYKQPGETTITLAPSLTEDTPLSAHTFSLDEKTSGIPTWADVKENVINFPEEETLKSAPETDRESVEQTTEVLKGHDFDSEEHEEKNEDREVEERKEKEESIGTEQQSLIVEVTAVMDNDEKEVEAIINNSTQERRLEAGPTDFIQPGENTITLAPSLTEEAPLSTHTFSPDEESSEFLTWADVKENVTRFVEEEPLKSAPETKRESVERTEDEETSEILDVKESVIQFVEEKSLKSVPDTERESVEQTTEVDSSVTEVLKGQDFDSEEHEEKNEDREVEKRTEEEGTFGTEQQNLIVEVTAVMDHNEKEVEVITNNSTQEFRLEAGPTDFIQPDENTITLAPSLTEDPPLSAHTFSPDEESSEFPTWADVKESIIHSAEEESLKSVPETKRESVEQTTEVDSSVTEVLKGPDFDSEEHEEENEDREVEERTEEEGTIGTEQQNLIVEVTTVMDKSEKEVEAIINNSTQEFRLDAGSKDFIQPGETTITLAPSSTEDTPLSTHTFSPDEESSGIPTWADVKENVINFVEEESLKSVPETERESVEQTTEVGNTLTEVLKGQDFDSEDREVKQRTDEEGTIGTEQEKQIVEVTAVIDNNENEVEAIINNSTQEFRLDAGLTEYKQLVENTITLAPSLTEGTPLSAHTFSPDEESSEILDVKETVIHFDGEESLKSAPQIERKSMEGTEDEETSEIPTWADIKENVIRFVEEKFLKSVPETERESVEQTTEVDSTLTEVLKGQDFDSEEHEEENKDSNWTEERTNGTEQQSLIMEVTASMDKDEKEVEVIINNSTQEFRLDAGLGENTITLAPSLTEDAPLSAQTFSPGEETNKILTWADVKENVTSFVEEESLKSAPETQKESVEWTEDEETSEILVGTESVIHFVEEGSLKSVPEIERESVQWTKNVDSTLPEVLKGQDFDSEEHEEKNEDREVEQREEEEEINSTEQQSLITEVTAVMDKNEKEVEAVINNSTQQFRLYARFAECKQPSETTITLAPSLTEDTSLSAHTFSPDEKTSGIPTWADVKESVIRFPEEESLNSAPEIERESMEKIKEVDSTLAEVLKGQDFDHEEHEEKNEDREVEQRKEVTNGTEQQSLIMEVTSVMDNNEKEVEAITNNSTQEFRLEAGPTDFIQPDENTITLAPSLTEDPPLSTHTFSPDEESSEILTWADVKENNTRFVEEEPLKTVPETERESVERTEDEETSEILDVKESVIHCVEEESLKSVPETERESVEQTTEVDSTLSEVLKGQDFDSEEHEEKSEDKEVKQRKEEERTIGTEQEKQIVEVTAVMDNKEKEVEAIINNSTQEFRVDAGLGENTTTLAPSLTEDTPPSAQTFSPDEETNKILTWTDVKENVIHFVEQESLESAPETERESVEQTTEVDSTLTNVLKGQDFDSKEHEDIEVEQRKENTNTLAPSLTEDTPLSAHTFNPDEETSEILTWADVKDSVIHFVEEESPKITRESMETTEEVQENTEAELPGTVMLKGQDFEEPEEKYQTDSEAKDRQCTGIKKEGLIEEVNDVIDDNEKEGTTQSSSALQGDPDRISEYAEQKGMDTHGRNRQLDEYHAEEEHGQSEDESLNISASWTTDPGEAYAHENTLADTRPLIHYKSEDETDADTKISHLGMTETNDSESEGEKQEGEGHWSQKLTKRFDTMEDLSEEPEMCNVDDVVTYGSVHTMIEGYEEEVSEEYAQLVDEGHLQREGGDTEHGLMDAALVNHPQSGLINNSEENSHGEEETMKENTLVVEKQEESSDFQDWSEGFPSDTREVNDILPTEQSNNSEDDITKDNAGNWESTESNPEQEVKAHFAYIPVVADIPVAEPPQQTLEEFTFETAMIKGQVCPKDEDEQSNLSLLTHADLTDSFSLHSGLSSRPESYTANSEHEVSNSSDDESPNASRCSWILPHPDVQTQQVDWTTACGGFLENDSGSFTGLLEDDPIVAFAKDTQEYHTEESETLGSQNKEEKQCTGSSGIDENAGSLLQTHEHDDVECASHSILSTVQEHGVLKTENQNEADAFQGDDLNEESQTREKENDPHSFFSSGIKKGIWSTTQFEMAATFDPLDQTETEKDPLDSVHPNQSWRNPESLPSTNGKPEKEPGISLAQSVLEEREDQKIPQAKQLQCRDVRDEMVEAVHSGDSTDDGDSWSSGEE